MARRKLRSETERKEFLGRLVSQELERAEGIPGDELSANRELALRYYNGELPGPQIDDQGEIIEGRSQIVSMDVCSTVNATLALMRDMLILDARLSIDPDGEGDEVAAQAEADICTDVLMKENRGELALLAAIKDGLLLRNGCIKVRMLSGECVVDAVPIENVCYSSGWSGRLQLVPFFAERIDYTRSDLVEMGIPRAVVDRLPAGSEWQSGTAAARNRAAQRQRDTESWDQEEIRCHEAYVLADLDNDGISERYMCLVANESTCLEYERVPFLPYSLGAPFIAGHRLTGESLFDRVGPLQDSNTTMLRQWHDNVAVVNNGRYIYDPSAANEDDIMSPSAGGGIRARDPGNSVVPLVVPDMTGGIAAAMEYNRRQRSEVAGAALDMSSAQAQLANRAATVASIEKGNQELITSMIASNFALTLVYGVYRLIHEHLRRYAGRPYLARVRGKSVSVDPQELFKPGRRMIIRCGLSPSQKAQQLAALGQHMQLGAMAMQQGMAGILADATTLYRTSQEWLRGNGIEDPERLAIDPASEAAQQRAQQQGQAAQQQAQMAQQAAALQQQMAQLAIQLEQAKIAEDARQADQELRFKYFDAQLDAEKEEAKIAAQGTVDLEKERIRDEGAARRELARMAAERAAGAESGRDEAGGGSASTEGDTGAA